MTTTPGDPSASTVLPLDLTGTVGDDGSTITGRGSDAGVNCTYEFEGRRVSTIPTTTTVPTTAPPPTTTPPAPPPTVTTMPVVPLSCDRAGALAKTIELHPDTVLRSADAVLACGGGWAVVTYGNGTDLNEVLRSTNGQWVEATPADNVCAAPGVPEDVHLYACMTN